MRAISHGPFPVAELDVRVAPAVRSRAVHVRIHVKALVCDADVLARVVGSLENRVQGLVLQLGLELLELKSAHADHSLPRRVAELELDFRLDDVGVLTQLRVVNEGLTRRSG